MALGRPGEGVFHVGRVEHNPAAVAALVARIAVLEPDPAGVRVVIETRHGLLVEALVDAGYTVLPVNPDLVARRRGPARKKDDAEDARIACVIALDQYTNLRALVPHGDLAGELRTIARDDVRASHDERRLLNRLRADLAATFPAALEFAGADLDSPVVLKLLQRWPTAAALTAAGTGEIEAFARSCRHGWARRFADRIEQTLTSQHFQARDYLIRAKTATIQLACAQLLLLREQRRIWQRRMGELLIGSRRQVRARQFADDRSPAVSGGEIYLSFPGIGDRLAARIAGEIGDTIKQFDTPNALQCYAGKAPVTRRSGKSELVVATRLACNRYLADAVQHWAFASLSYSIWAREFYDAHQSRGKRHHATLRALGNRWLEILWHCLTKNTPYDENVHIANRNRALGRATQRQPTTANSGG